jgi:hypothetical protein
MLWIPDGPNRTQGTMHTLQTDIGSQIILRGPNAYGQVAGLTGQGFFLWTPDQAHAAVGEITWLPTEMDILWALNDCGQLLGGPDTDDVALLWTPTRAHGATGQLTRIDKPWNSTAIRFFRLNDQGALAGVAIDVSRLSGLTDDVVVWLPDAPNSPSGHLQTLGALGWNEDGAAYDINAAGTAAGDSCFVVRQGSDYPCRQERYFVWDQRHAMTDLQTLLGPASGNTVDGLEALNDAGQIVLLGESSPDTYRLLLLTPRSGDSG